MATGIVSGYTRTLEQWGMSVTRTNWKKVFEDHPIDPQRVPFGFNGKLVNIPKERGTEVCTKILFVEQIRSGAPHAFTDVNVLVRALAEAKACAINFAKKCYPELLGGAPAHFNDPIHLNLFAQPETHFCGGAQHQIDSCNSSQLPDMAIAMRYAREKKSVPESICPYTRTPITPTVDYDLQEEIYQFVLKRMGVLPSFEPTHGFPSASTSVSFAPQTTPLAASSSTGSVVRPPQATSLASSFSTGSVVRSSAPASSVQALQALGGVISTLLRKIDERYPPLPEPVHDERGDDGCKTCMSAIGTIPKSEYNVGEAFAQIHKGIAALPMELQGALYGKIWQKRENADPSASSNWGQEHLLSNLHKTLSSVRELMREEMVKPKRASVVWG